MRWDGCGKKCTQEEESKITEKIMSMLIDGSKPLSTDKETSLINHERNQAKTTRDASSSSFWFAYLFMLENAHVKYNTLIKNNLYWWNQYEILKLNQIRV
jgi:hypothetical protein